MDALPTAFVHLLRPWLLLGQTWMAWPAATSGWVASNGVSLAGS